MRRGILLVVVFVCLWPIAVLPVQLRAAPADTAMSRVPLAHMIDAEVTLFAPAGAAAELQDGCAQPLSLAEADLDRDGVSDVIEGCAASGGGVVVVLRGSGDAFTRAVEASALPIAPQFLVTGDFDADGAVEAAAAAMDGDAVHLLEWDGAALLRWSRRLDLPGRITALAAGEFGEPDGLRDLAVGLRRGDRAEVWIYSSVFGALAATPEVVDAPADVGALIFGLYDEDAESDLAVAAGSAVGVVRSGDAGARELATVPFATKVVSLAAARFQPGATEQLAALRTGGSITVLRSVDGRLVEQTSFAAGEDAERLLAGKVSTGDGEDLIVLAPSSHQLRVHPGGLELGATAVTVGAPGAPASALALRINGDGLEDLIVAIAERVSPSLALTGGVAGSFTVNSVIDNPDANVGDNICADPAGNCTLRAAIQEANAKPDLTTINFDLGPGTPTIDLIEALPTITTTVVIDGATGGATRVELNGAPVRVHAIRLATGGGSAVKSLVINRVSTGGVAIRIDSANNVVENCWIGLDRDGGTSVGGNTGGGVLITGTTATGNTIGGTTAAARCVISHNTGSGVRITAGAASNLVLGNYIGADVDGGGVTPNTGNSGEGVRIDGGAKNNVVGQGAGAPGLPPGNIISRNGLNGVLITGAGVEGTTVSGNLIGLDASGVASLPNGANGVEIAAGATSNVVGGPAYDKRNVISGNGGALNAGVLIGGSGTTGNSVRANWIGVDRFGGAALGNGGAGVTIKTGAQNNTIGGAVLQPGTGVGNVIAGHQTDANSCGVQIDGAGTSNNTVAGNLIGVAPSGVAAIGNRRAGVVISGGATNNTVGGAVGADMKNLISGNDVGSTSNGVEITGAGTSNNTVAANYIGLSLFGDPLPNGQHGVSIASGASDNVIGGATGLMAPECTGACNRIEGNLAAGVRVEGATTVRNAIRGNRIDLNGGLGIDIGAAGVTPNDAATCDPDAGANNLQNFPVVVFVTWDLLANSTSIIGTLNGVADATFEIEAFANVGPDLSGFGEGRIRVGATTVTTASAPDCSVDWAVGPVVGLWQWVSVTATDPTGNTSEFSAAVDVTSDADSDGVRDPYDCAPESASVWAAPPEIQRFVFPSPIGNKTDFAWDALAALTGPGTSYDVVRGALGEFPVGWGPSEACLQDNLAATTWPDAETPAPGGGFYYVVRGDNVCGPGTYGSQSNGDPRAPTACTP